MHCEVKEQQALALLAQFTEQLRIKQARLHDLPEQAELQKLLETQTQLRDEAAKARIEQRQHWQHIERLKQDIAKMRMRRQDVKKSLSAETDKEQRKDLYHDLDSTADRLSRMEEQLASEQRTRSLFSDPDQDTTVSGLAEARHRAEQAKTEITTEIQQLDNQIAETRTEISEPVLREYDSQEAEHGIGAASLRANVCQACFMELDPLSLKQLRTKPREELGRCPECNVILLTVGDDGK